MKEKTNNALVSIIVPAYNAEAYIARCLDSILGQDYSAIEVIVIDNGSNDGTKGIINDYKKNDTRVILATQSRKGPNAARGKGIELVHGDYVMFVDADDCIMEGAVSKLVDAFSNNDVDVIRYNAFYKDGGGLVCPLPMMYRKTIGRKEIAKLLAKTSCLNALCFQIYKTDLVKNIKAFKSDIFYGEDLLANAEIHEKTNRMLISDDVLYCYRDNPNSTTHNVNRNRIIRNALDRVFVSRKMIIFIQNNVNDDTVRLESIYYQIKMIRNRLVALCRIKHYSKTQCMKDLKYILPDNVFSEVDCRSIDRYIETLGIVERTKNARITKAIISCNYNYIWKYILINRIYRKVVKRSS